MSLPPLPQPPKLPQAGLSLQPATPDFNSFEKPALTLPAGERAAHHPACCSKRREARHRDAACARASQSLCARSAATPPPVGRAVTEEYTAGVHSSQQPISVSIGGGAAAAGDAAIGGLLPGEKISLPPRSAATCA